MISIRNAKNAKIGLNDMVNYINSHIDVKKSVICEIGSYVGDSTKIFAENFKAVYCVDPWVNGYDDNDAASYQHDMDIIERQFDETVMGVYENVFKHKGKSLDVVNSFPDDFFDVVYIDGIHTYGEVKRDINAWIKKVRPGGFISGHDYQGKFPGTIKAVDEFCKPEKTFKDTSWIVRC